MKQPSGHSRLHLSPAPITRRPLLSLLAGPPRLLINPTPDYIYIPRKNRRTPLQGLAGLPVSLQRVLQYFGYQRLGELHGLRFICFKRLRRCGPKTLAALEHVLTALGGGVTYPELLRKPVFIPASSLSRTEELLCCPVCARPVKLQAVPLSARTKRALAQAGVNTLGELDGVPVARLHLLRGVANNKIREIRAILRRAEDKEFAPV